MASLEAGSLLGRPYRSASASLRFVELTSALTFAGLAADSWTAIGTWVTAGVAAAAVGLTAVSLSRDRRRLSKLEDREKENTRRERRSQASRVFFEDPRKIEAVSSDTTRAGYSAELKNASEGPIYHVVVLFREVLIDQLDPHTGAAKTGAEELAGPAQVRVGLGGSLTFANMALPIWPRSEEVAQFRNASGVNWRPNS